MLYHLSYTPEHTIGTAVRRLLLWRTDDTGRRRKHNSNSASRIFMSESDNGSDP